MFEKLAKALDVYTDKIKEVASALSLPPTKATMYIAGRITDDPGYVEKFAEAASDITAAGFVAVNPAILPPNVFEYDAYMRMSGAMLRECDAVCLLDDWPQSKGARQEIAAALKGSKDIYTIADIRAIAQGGQDSDLCTEGA
jgi:hypothetical protein